MPRQSTPLASPKYPIESEMINPIRTDISVGDLNLFRTFLDANDMKSIELGYYEYHDPDNWNKWMTTNLICYSNNNPSYLIECNIMYMTMKFGGLIQAFEQFKSDIGRNL